MTYRNYSVIRIFVEAFGINLCGWRLISALIAIALIACGMAFKVWLLLLPSLLLLAGSLLWERLRPPSDAAGAILGISAANQADAPTLAHAASKRSDQSPQAHMAHIADQILSQHPHWREARLIKASLLWHFNGDRDGARCHCRDLLGRIQRDDPLFDQVCDLYMRTFDPVPSQAMPPAYQIAAEPGLQDWTADSGIKRAKIIPLPSKRLRAKTY